MIVSTEIDWVMWWMKARNMPTEASTSRNDTVTAICGTEAWPALEDALTARNTVSA